MQERLRAAGLEIAHLKMTLTPDEEGGDIGVCNLVRTDGRTEQSHTLREPLASGALILNLRAEGDPEALHAAALDAIHSGAAVCGARAVLEHEEHFRPGRPVPTHRMAM